MSEPEPVGLIGGPYCGLAYEPPSTGATPPLLRLAARPDAPPIVHIYSLRESWGRPVFVHIGWVPRPMPVAT